MKQASKHFFFEKKKQKTFVHPGRALGFANAPANPVVMPAKAGISPAISTSSSRPAQSIRVRNKNHCDDADPTVPGKSKFFCFFLFTKRSPFFAPRPSFEDHPA